MDELDELRAQAAAAGVKVDGRWGVDRLRAEIAAAQPEPDQKAPETGPESTLSQDHDESGVSEAGAPDAQRSAQGDDEPDDEERSDGLTPYIRAGGHIDRGDGRGWVIEE